MNNVDEKIIELSKSKLVATTVGGLVFVALGIWMLTIDSQVIRTSRSFHLFLNNPLYVRALGITAIVFFGLCAVLCLKKLIDTRPGLVLNPSGIVDNSSGISAGFIPWSEIIGSDVMFIQRQKLLIIKITDPQKYIDRGNSARKLLNNANSKMCGSPVVISSNALKIDFQELVSLFNHYHQKYGIRPTGFSPNESSSYSNLSR